MRVYFATAPVNLRKSYDRLSNEVRSALREDPLSGHIFAFLNRRKTQVKLLLWTRGGFTIVQKRLERGTFTFPQRDDEARRLERDRLSRHLYDELVRWCRGHRAQKPPSFRGAARAKWNCIRCVNASHEAA